MISWAPSRVPGSIGTARLRYAESTRAVNKSEIIGALEELHMLIRHRLLLASALVLAIQLSPAAEPARKYLDKETFFQMESVSNPEISPDGSLVAFGRGFVDVMKDQNASNLWLIDAGGQRLRQLT